MNEDLEVVVKGLDMLLKIAEEKKGENNQYGPQIKVLVFIGGSTKNQSKNQNYQELMLQAINLKRFYNYNYNVSDFNEPLKLYDYVVVKTSKGISTGVVVELDSEGYSIPEDLKVLSKVSRIKEMDEVLIPKLVQVENNRLERLIDAKVKEEFKQEAINKYPELQKISSTIVGLQDLLKGNK